MAKEQPAKAKEQPAKDGDKAAEKNSGSEIKVERKGNYVYWFAFTDSDGVEQTTLPQRFKGKSTELDTAVLGEKFTGAKLYVMDRGTGNTAIADFKPNSTVEFNAGDFEYIHNVKLRIVSEDGRPLESALVQITDGENTEMQALVTPADEGVASFDDVASGTINIEVDANGVKRTIDSDIEIPEKRSTPGFEADVKVRGDVDTLAIEPKKGPASGGSTPDKSPSSGGIVLQTLLGLVFLGIVGGAIFVVLKSRGVTAKIALQSLGVDMPGQQNDPFTAGQTQAGASHVDPSVCAFCGQRKDASGNCACTVVPGAAPGSPFNAPASTGVPRLIGTQGVYSGHIFELTSPSVIIGREAGNPVALPNDSTSSRRHATITSSNGAYTIRDEGSSNGTFVNGAKIVEQQLRPGDEVQVGGTKFRFEV